jgi:radical SAM superfamily enzyme YgiQ (UPF0313 family)
VLTGYNLTYTTLSLATEAFPLNIGFVGAYCKAIYGTDVQITLFKYIDDLDEAIRKAPPDILGLSNYPWNYQVGIEFFKFARNLHSKTICVMGGPNFPLDQELQTKFILENPEIDFYCYLEGEEAFSNLVGRVIEIGPNLKKLKQAPIGGMIHTISDSEALKGAFLTRRNKLDEIPSPYLTGLLDKFFDGILSPMLETNRGCPFQCTFCHEGSPLINKVNHFSTQRVKAEIDYIAAHVPSNIHYLMFADPNFGMYARDLEICDHIAGIQQTQGYPKSLFASTGKNKKERISKALRKLNGTMKLWMSVQSLDEEVLENVQRDNIKLEQMMGLAEVFKEFELPTYSELILGLPGETYQSHIQSISKVIEAGIDSLSTHTLMLLNGTQLTLQSERKKYGLETHFRILPRDFGKLSNGAYPVEIEEVVTSTSAMSFDDYCALRIMHLIINVTYNGKAFGPLFKFFRETCISVFDLITALVQNTYNANPEVQEVIDSFSRKTLSELWESRKDLQAYAATEDAHKQLLNEEVGENLIQTHTARSTRIMSEWAKYVFDTANTICADKKLNHEELAMLDEIRLFCTSRVHDIWGLDRGENNPIHKFSYDIADWYSSEKSSLPLSAFKLGNKKWIEFRYSNDKLQEIDDFIGLLGTTNTGLGRILIKTDITKLWREPVTVTPPIEFDRGNSTEVE